MKKMIALYKAPADAEAFLAHYRATHFPLVEKIPGMVRCEVTLVDRTLMGEPGNHMLAEMYFADEESFKAAMKSPENMACGADLANFADGLATIMTGTVLEP